ncbi:MAG TPA: NAD(P)-dependent oxidoreductase [Usitatibacter sp.]|nr:NAD(P)-dependent oxidoreductase [Usitatibacter sp.]
MSSRPRVGVIGVGAMGMGVAKALLARGFAVTVRDIDPAREAEAQGAGAAVAPSAEDLCTAVDVAVTLVVDADQTRAVTRGTPPVFLMCSTIAPSDTEEIARGLAARGVALLDAPISGGPARAHAGTLSIMAGGTDAAYAACGPVLAAIGARIFRVGAKPGDGSRMKVVNNMLAAANLAAGCEAMAMAALLGLDLRQVAEVVDASSGASWMFSDRMPRALDGDYAPRAASRVLLKDVGLFVHEARRLGLTAPMAECAREIFHDTVARGFGEEDDAAVLKRYAAAWNARIE